MTANQLAFKRRGLAMRYLLVTWLLVLSAVAFLDRANIGVAGAQIGREFRIDNARLGWVFSAFLLGYAAFQVPGGMLARRFGPRRVLTLSLTWWGIFITLTALVPSTMRGALIALVMVRFLLGAGEATMFPAMNCFTERWFPVAERGKANGIIFGGVGLGSGLAPPLATAIILRYGWHVLFWGCGALGVLVGVVWYVIARDTPEEHPAIGAAELELIKRGRGDYPDSAATEPEQARQPAKVSREIPWRRIFASKEAFGLTASYFCYGYVSWIFFSWFYIYLAEVRGLNLKTTAVYSMFPFIFMTIGSLAGGAVSDWITRRYGARAGRCFFPSFALVLTAALLAIGCFAHDAGMATAVLACGAGSLYLSQSSYWSVSADFGGEHAGVVSGLMNTGCQIGAATTASLTPLIAEHFGWEVSFLTGTVLAVAGAFAWLVVNPHRRLSVIVPQNAGWGPK
jgi:ACS family glucarate transporter-like MFS transporter